MWMLLMIGWILTPATVFIEKYVFNDWQFLVFLMVMITCDSVIAIVCHWKNRSLSNKGFAKLFIKVIIYTCFLTATHALRYYTIEGIPNSIFTWVDYFCYSAIMLREFMSILEGIACLNPNIIPAWVMKRFKAFDTEGNFIKPDDKIKPINP
jgi:hypothetical protein